MDKEKEIESKPLTVEELKVLKRHDWIWLVESGHGIYRVIQHSTDSNIYVSSPCAELKTFDYVDYGTKWIAYKNKEEAENAGYGNVKQAVKEFAEMVKENLEYIVMQAVDKSWGAAYEYINQLVKRTLRRGDINDKRTEKDH